MYLRRNRSTANGETYEYWTLVESVRTADGPSQHTVATLGKLPGLDKSSRLGWEQIEQLLEGDPPATQLSLREVGSAIKPAAAVNLPEWRAVNGHGGRVERVREFGEV